MSERIEIPNTKITLYGSKQEIKRAMSYLNKVNQNKRSPAMNIRAGLC